VSVLAPPSSDAVRLPRRQAEQCVCLEGHPASHPSHKCRLQWRLLVDGTFAHGPRSARHAQYTAPSPPQPLVPSSTTPPPVLTTVTSSIVAVAAPAAPFACEGTGEVGPDGHGEGAGDGLVVEPLLPPTPEASDPLPPSLVEGSRFRLATGGGGGADFFFCWPPSWPSLISQTLTTWFILWSPSTCTPLPFLVCFYPTNTSGSADQPRCCRVWDLLPQWFSEGKDILRGRKKLMPLLLVQYRSWRHMEPPQLTATPPGFMRRYVL
jgi:hypothetical protein